MHTIQGSWITDREFCGLAPRNVFHRQLEKVDLPCTEHRNRHILFRRHFDLDRIPQKAEIRITADDYYKLYVNGVFAGQGPAPAYHFHYGYNTLDITPYLREGENVLAVHTLYQGLINRVWQSGDLRHGLLCDVTADGVLLFGSDASFRTAPHTGYTETGTVGYETQFLETYDSSAAEVGFQAPDFDDSGWENALCNPADDHTVVPQETASLVWEEVAPAVSAMRGSTLYLDFGGCYVGYLAVRARGEAGSRVTVRCAQELREDGSIRYDLRANCNYTEEWILFGGEDALDWFDYKAFRYAELILPPGCTVEDVRLRARHYPFALCAAMKAEYARDERLRRIWDLCVRTQKYGVQEIIQDCMEREKGFYVGDGCYTALAHMVLSGDDSIVRKLIDDAFRSAFITPETVTCLDCSFMQEIAEYPLMLISLILWHHRRTGDRDYLAENYRKLLPILEAYRTRYERDGLLRDLERWCVVEWPANFRDGYDVDITEGQVCHEPHVAINAYYIEAVRNANRIAAVLDLPPYRDESILTDAFLRAFYDPDRHLFTDSLASDHVSFIGNVLSFGFMMPPDAACEERILAMIRERGITGVSFFGAFPLLTGLVRRGLWDDVRNMLTDENAWLCMLREDATTTFEGWSRDAKWNTSLFHMTLSYAALFLSDIDLGALFA